MVGISLLQRFVRFSRYRRSWTFDLCLFPWPRRLSSSLLSSFSPPVPRHNRLQSDRPRCRCHCRISSSLSSPEWYIQGWLSSSSPSELLRLELVQGRGRRWGWSQWDCWCSQYLCVEVERGVGPHRNILRPSWSGWLRPFVVGEKCWNCWEKQGELA